MKSLRVLFWLALLAASASAQVRGLVVREVDGSPRGVGITEIVVTNSTLTVNGQRATISISGGGGSGTVTSVAQSFTGGLISVGGSPVTTSGTLALTVAGTSGGVPYFSSGSTWASSAALAANAIVIGGGAGAAPSTTTTGTGVLTALGVNVGSAGAFVVFNGAGGTPSSLNLTNATGLPPTTGISGWPANASGVLTNNGSGTLSWAAASSGITVGTTTVTSGTATRLFYETAGNVVGQISTLTSDGTIVTFAPTVTTGTGASSGVVFTANSLTTGTGINFSTNSITSGSLINIASTSTAAASNTLTGLNIAISGANASSAQIVTGQRISVTNTNATSGFNYALQLTASGATGAAGSGENRAIDVTAGQVVLANADRLRPSLTFQSNKATGLYSASSTVIGFTVNASEAAVLNSFSFVLQNGGGDGFQIASSTATSGDVKLGREGAANWRLGAAAAASPVAQTLSVQNVVAGTTNTAGTTWTLRGSLGTSQGVPGRIHLTSGAMIAASGTTQQTAVDRIISGATKVLTNNSATTIVNVTNATETSAGGVLDYCVEVTDGTDTQYECGMATYGISNKAGVFSGNTVTKFGNHQNATSGTLTVTFAISGANPGALSINANSSLSPSTGYPRVVYSLRNLGNQAVAVQ